MVHQLIQVLAAELSLVLLVYNFLIFFGKFDGISWEFAMSEIYKKSHLSIFLFLWKLILLVEAIIHANGCWLIDELNFIFAIRIFPSNQQSIQQSLSLMMS